jgi:hypothetical protein
MQLMRFWFSVDERNWGNQASARPGPVKWAVQATSWLYPRGSLIWGSGWPARPGKLTGAVCDLALSEEDRQIAGSRMSKRPAL